jgi:PAS domain S-box-containing protein
MEDEAFYKICFDSLIDGLCIANDQGRIVMNNSACEEIFGYESGELIGKSIEILIPEHHREVHQYHFQTYFQHPRKFKKGKGREFFGRHKNGEILDLEIGLNFFEYKGQRFAKALIAEISTRKQKETQIKESNKRLENEVDRRTHLLTEAVSKLERANLLLKDEVNERISAEKNAKRAFKKEKELNQMQIKFLSMVSHEFKTPLSGILTSAGLIEKYNEKAATGRISNHVATIKNLVLQLNDILDDFLFLENSETGRYQFSSTRFMFCDLMRKVVTDAEALMKPGQQIRITPCEHSIEVLQDHKVVDIIIRNLLYNAIKYSPENSSIDVTISVNDMICIEIRDQGIGIPEGAKKHIFDRFFRAKNVLHIQGTGIGLNIVRRHLHRMNGSIEIKSKEHEGTIVSLRIPIISNQGHQCGNSSTDDKATSFGYKQSFQKSGI